MAWHENLRKIAFGRQVWRPGDEYAYYRVDSVVVREQARRQIEFAKEFYFSGLQIARSMGVLDPGQIHGKTVLELGAGECLLAQALLACGARKVVAVDAVPKQIWAAALFNRDHPGLECVLADASRLPYEDDSFDLIVGNLILHHIEPLAPVLMEVRRLLAPGGTFVANEPSFLVGAFVHHPTSLNEAPIRPKKVREALAGAGLIETTFTYWWNRMQTSKLGILSPGYVVRGRVPGMPRSSVLKTSRPLVESGVPGLVLDRECGFNDLVAKQVDEVRLAWRNLEKPAVWEDHFGPW